MTRAFFLIAMVVCAATASAAEKWVDYEGGQGPGEGMRIVLVSGDEEYRSEQSLPMLAKILAVRHGFDTRVLFAINPKTGFIEPTYNKNIPGLQSLAEADLMIIATRWRDLPDEQMAAIDAYLKAGKPVIGLRTATHAFKPSDPDWVHYADGYDGPKTAWHGGFGRLVLGEQWVAHHGAHGKQATRGILTEVGKKSPITRGISSGEIFGPTDVYKVRLPLPGDSEPLVLGQVLAGMSPDSPPVTGGKNDPMMPIAWTKSYQLPGGEPGRAFTTTMGAATDFKNAALRKLVVNAAYTLLGLSDAIPAEGTDVRLVGPYQPWDFGFGDFEQGMVPGDFAISKER